MTNSNLPPTNIEPVDLFNQLMTLPRAFRKVEVSINNQKTTVAIWILKSNESQLCSLEAEKWTRKLLKDNGGVPKDDERSEGYKTLYENRAMAEIVYRCCRNPDDVTKPFFPVTVDVLCNKLSKDEIAIIFNQYLIIQQEIGPIVSKMEQYELDAWIDIIAKGGASNFLASTTLGAQSQLLTYMAAQLSNSRTDTSSSTSLPEENLKEDSNN